SAIHKSPIFELWSKSPLNSSHTPVVITGSASLAFLGPVCLSSCLPPYSDTATFLQFLFYRLPSNLFFGDIHGRCNSICFSRPVLVRLDFRARFCGLVFCSSCG
ncbi:hypothetical protein CUMW_100970, partial [Citrus unshiu]